MKSLLLLVVLCAVLVVGGCMAKPNKFCQFEAFSIKKCVALDSELTETRCKDIGGVPSPDCGK